MKLADTFKKFLIGAGLAVFVTAGYLSLNVATSCKAQAQCVCGICTYAMGGLLSTTASVVTPWSTGAIGVAFASITVQFEIAMVGFNAAISAKIFEVQQLQNKWWDEFWYYNLRPALQAMTVQLNVRDADQSRLIGAFGDALDLSRTNMALMQSEIESHRELRPGENDCVAATNAGTITKANAIRNAYGAAAAAEMLPRGNNREGTPAGGGPGEDVRARWDNYVARYCDPTANAGAAGCTAPGGFANRDLDVAGEIFMKDTIDVRDPDVKQIVDDMVINLAEPYVMDPMPEKMLDESAATDFTLKANAYKARRQAIHDTLYHIISRRVPGGTEGAEFLNQMREQAGLDIAYTGDSPSYNEIMEVMTSERFRTGQYGISQVDEPPNNAREAVIQQAFMAMQLSDTLDLLDHYALVLASQASGEVNNAQAHVRDTEVEERPRQ